MDIPDMEDGLHIGIKDNLLLIKAAGEMRAGNTFALNKFLIPYLEKTDKKLTITIDLGSCTFMDSSFIGFLVSLESKCKLSNQDSVKIINPTAQCRRTLKGLSCLDRISIINSAEAPRIATFRLKDEPGDFSARENIELLFEAHMELSALSEENRLEFRDLLAELKRVLAKK